LASAWERGDAVLPVDPRLPVPAARVLVDAMRPSVVVDESGEHRQVPGGLPVRDGDALVVATGGTTGEPRGVVLTHDAVRASAAASNARLEVDPARDRWLAVLPVAHIGGLSVVTRAVVTSTALTFDPDDPKATLVSVVPTQANRMDLTRFRVVLVGGSADWRDRPGNVVRTYGMTETGSGVAYDGLPLGGAEIDVDGRGEILIRGGMLLRCYRDGSVDGIDPRDDAGRLRTGDAGAWEGGRLVVHGRIGDVIVTGGEKVWPGAVEERLRTHPSVGDVAVAGRPDPDWGEEVVAWVVRTPDGPLPLLESLREHVKEALPAYAAPRRLVVVSSLPRTPIGKVRRNNLPDPR
jgi:O-succinylbenzoic acid--CoA ligase